MTDTKRRTFREETTRTFLCSHTNSTTFTRCCRVAVTRDGERCPRCEREVLPYGSSARWREAYDYAKRAGYGR